MVVSTTFFIEGQVVPKKNERQVFVKKGRVINIPSKRYKEWHDQAMWQMKEATTLEPPYEIIMTFWFKDKRPRDLDNVQSSVLDLLQDAGVIKDDDSKLLTKITAIYGGVSKDAPRVKIEIHAGCDNPIDKS